MKKTKNYLVLLVLLLSVNPLFAQEVEMADKFRSEGKIYVVVLVASLVFLGIVMYLIYLDRKLRKLEKELENHKK